MTGKVICDHETKSRKGRKPKHGVAMTAAERKRRQRDRQAKEKSDLPSWLRLRHRLLEVVINQFTCANVDELCHALEALHLSLFMMNAYHSDAKIEDWRWPLNEYITANDNSLFTFGPYAFNEASFAERKNTTLIELILSIRDTRKRHENKLTGGEDDE